MKLLKWEAPKWAAVGILVFAVTIGSWIGKLKAQQMSSGGTAVTVTSGSVTVSQSTASNLKVDLSGTAANATAIKVDPSAVTSPVSLASLPALAASTNLIGRTYPYTSCGTTAYSAALQAMPTSSTAVASSTTCLLMLNITNTSAGPLTVTVSDNQGTPVLFLNSVTINAGETRTYPFSPGGAKFTSGIKMQASGSGIQYTAEGLQ